MLISFIHKIYYNSYVLKCVGVSLMAVIGRLEVEHRIPRVNHVQNAAQQFRGCLYFVQRGVDNNQVTRSIARFLAGVLSFAPYFIFSVVDGFIMGVSEAATRTVNNRAYRFLDNHGPHIGFGRVFSYALGR